MDRPQVDLALVQIVRHLWPDSRVVAARAFGADDASESATQLTAKATGYGVPILLEVQTDNARLKLVLHGTTKNQFGHDRRADRAAAMILAADTTSAIPRHGRVLDYGAFREDGSTVSLRGSGELYVLSEFVPGQPYAEDLRRLGEASAASEADVARACALARYLLELHAPRHDEGGQYARSVRDLLGSGEGIFGIIDGYPAGTPGASPHRLRALERRCLDWRWRLKEQAGRLRRTHGDFHPFNIVFDDAGELHVLDASRGCLGDAADDVTCLAVNYVFFALSHEGSWPSSFRPLWRALWQTYLSGTTDQQLLDVAAPFLAWRLLVLACPVWYPNLSREARDRLLSLAEAALDADRFDPDLAEQVLR